ncbi:MAG: lysylphosphatidylglycerol synthase domain-containing protein [Rickettsiales bacterium]|jgi:phosphatidylglycerol lysyltransferase|nr:lysylphosphatidylglycerol synthase domain-containing protein [Rickettsiales bacterium]
MKKLISWSGLVFFALAAVMLYWQLSHYSLMEILHILWNIPPRNLFLACVAAFFGYVALSFYDYLALRYIGRMVSWWKWMLAGMLGFAISNNAGHAVISGGSIRYRLYTRWRIKASEIVKMVGFSGFTYFIGCISIVTVAFFMVPRETFSGEIMGGVGMNLFMAFCLASLLLYFGGSLFYRKKIRIFNLKFRLPNFWTAMWQAIIGMTDSVLAGLVLYSILSAFVDIPFMTFISVFVIAQVVGVFSQVPGGIGVFETMFMLAMPELAGGSNAALFASLIAYRIIYFLLPLLGIGGAFVVYEYILRSRMKRWIEEAKAASVRAGHIAAAPFVAVSHGVYNITHRHKGDATIRRGARATKVRAEPGPRRGLRWLKKSNKD